MDPLPWLNLLAPIALAIAGWNFQQRRNDREACESLSKQLADFKVKVATEYASHDYIRDMKREILDAISNLGQRLDRQAERGQ